MAHAAPPLPKRFPCWCRATYSWGGESKRDLGFIEGDLIECLNAGDGSWWMGRLRRNKQTGLFPSNFVQVLDPSFSPVSRATSPSVNGAAGAASAAVGSQIVPKKSKTFRKPFQSYSSVPYAKPVQTETKSSGAMSISRQNSWQSPALSQTPSRQSSPRQDEFAHHHSHPADRHHSSFSGRSFQQENNHRHQRRQSYRDDASDEQVDPEDFDSPDDRTSSSPPPAPPPHRVSVSAMASRRPSFHDQSNQQLSHKHDHPSRTNTPTSAASRPADMTPSPLRDAMNGVMSSLEGMRVQTESLSSKPDPIDPWSPEAFEELHARSRPRSTVGNERQGRRQPVGSAFQAGALDARLKHQHETNGLRLRESTPLNNDDQRHDSTNHRHEAYAGGNIVRPGSTRGEDFEIARRMSNGSRPVSSEDYLQSKDLPPEPPNRRLRARKSAYELGRGLLDRTFSQRTSATSSSYGTQSVTSSATTSTQRTSQSIMSGSSAGKFSATSAGSLARRKRRQTDGAGLTLTSLQDKDTEPDAMHSLGIALQNSRPQTPSAYSNRPLRPGSVVADDHSRNSVQSSNALRSRRSGFFRKLVDSAKAGAASTRSTIADGRVEQQRPAIKTLLPNGVNGIASNSSISGSASGSSGSARKGEVDWMQVRRDINRSNSLSRNEKAERRDRCEMLGHAVLAPVDELFDRVEGDESDTGGPVEQIVDYSLVNLQLVDKAARFVNGLPSSTNATSLATGYLCRPYRSDVQRLRAIFTWASEKVTWEEDFEAEVDTRRVISSRRGSSKEVAILVHEMCAAVGIHSEVVSGLLKTPEHILESKTRHRPNHWWNAVLVDGNWRMMDCSLASASHPKRSICPNTASAQQADFGLFLARPMELCYSHVPTHPAQQHLCPAISNDVLMTLPCTSPSYFKNGLQMSEFDASQLYIEDLELMQIKFLAPADVECFAEMHVGSYTRDMDGDLFESGDTIINRALAQAQWIDGLKQYVVKAHLPADEGSGILKVYAGKRGLTHSIRDNPHPLAFALPVVHTGQNPPFEFFLRHPTPHALRHDLYVCQPQCRRLAFNNTFVFAVRQHPSSLSIESSPSVTDRPVSPAAAGAALSRPGSAMSMVSASATDYSSRSGSNTAANGGDNVAPLDKPAKLAMQAPSGRIIRMVKKNDHVARTAGGAADGTVWETIIKIGERGTWRGLVLADRSARWCVFGEWDCP